MDVVLDVSGETAGIGAAAGDTLREQILAANGPQIDGVTGASITSNAVKEALVDCINQAGGNAVLVEPTEEPAVAEDVSDWLGTAPDISDSDCVETVDTEVLVVGAGCSGLFAAAAAAEAGAKTLLIERAGQGMSIRCSALGAVGSKIQKAHGVEIDKTEIINDMCHYALNANDMNLVKLWADNSGETLDWYADFLAKYGRCEIALEYTMPGEATRYACWPTGHGTKAIVMPEGANPLDYPEGLVYEDMMDYITGFGGEVRHQTTMLRLIQEDGKVVGIYAENKDGEKIRINASKGVILATGGYANNKQMYTALQPENLKSIATMLAYPFANGAGIKAAMWAGAKLDPNQCTMIFDRCAMQPDAEAGSPYGAPFTYFHMGTQPFLKVNKNGNRICNESSPYDFVVHGARKYDGNLWYQIFDSNWREDVTRFHTIGCSTMIQWEGGNHQGEGLDEVEASLPAFIEGGMLMKADTLEELADKLLIDKENFLATVARYNELAEKGEDEDFGKEPFRLSKIEKAPFYGVKLAGINLCTMNGLHINTRCQVLTAENKVIEGLYAVGNDSGDYYLDTYPNLCAGANAGRSATFGRLTGKYLASK